MNTRVRQHDITDCGAAALASVAACYKLHVPLSRIRQYANTDQQGTNLSGMIAAAEKLGFTAKGAKGTMDSLPKIPLPAIALVIVKAVLSHYVVIYKTTGKHVVVMDPVDGKMHRYQYAAFREIWTGVLIILFPGETFKEGKAAISAATRFWQLVQPHKAVLLQALFGALIYTLLGLSASVYIQKIIDYVLAGGNRNLLNMLSLIMIVVLLLQCFIGTLKTIFTISTGQQIDARLILGYYKHLMRLPQQFFDTMRTGEIISRVNDAVKIRLFINDAAVALLVNLLIVVFSFALMFTYSRKLTIIILPVVPLYGIIYFITNRVNKKVQRRLMERSAELESQLVESLNAISTIKRFGLESYANNKTETRFIPLLRTIYTSSLNTVFSGAAADFISRLFTILLLWAGAGFVIDRQLTPGELLSFYALINYFTGPVSSLIGMNQVIQDAMIAADRLFEIMDLEKERSQHTITLTPDRIGNISFEKVLFRYGSRTTVFESLTLQIPHAKITAIVGESGSGKTTLMNLLQNIYPIQEGTIHIGQHNLKYITSASLKKLIGVVPQQIDLFAGSVIENIALGDYWPDMQRIMDICTRLGMLPFIEALPNGFESSLGENGATLSGGQKQRIAIARALYRQPEILVLDEATASLDTAAIQHVQKAVQWMKQQQKTVIIIAHRLSTVRNADKIIMLEKGRVAEEGSHDELWMKKSRYYKLWNQDQIIKP